MERRTHIEKKKEHIRMLWEQAQKKRELHQEKPYLHRQPECELEFAGEFPLIRFRAFQAYPELLAAFSTRFGGVSKGDLSELNLGFGRGDTGEAVSQNYNRFCDALGITPETLVLSDQVHSTTVQCVSKADACGAEIRKTLKAADGLATAEKNLCLVTSYADCVPLFFYDPVKQVIAASHSGWKGTAGRIGEQTVKLLQREFGSDSRDIIAVIGPSICQDCYEVSRDVVEEMQKQYRTEQVEKFAVPSAKKDGKFQLDLWYANALQLLDSGITKEHLHVAGICTCCNSGLLFSHRASGGKRGNLCGFLSLAGTA
ncbi:MAG: peptidoglycan editing factor PgeF [Clostridiaceae bacterium]|nr:peptidoglycan editing factor PgeF [Clostridiaceae bacterium]